VLTKYVTVMLLIVLAEAALKMKFCILVLFYCHFSGGSRCTL